MADPSRTTALVVGLGLSGGAVARRLLAEGGRVVALDDTPDAATEARADALGLSVVRHPGPAELARLVGEADVVVPSPGVPERHPAIAAALAAGVPVLSEIELAYRWSPHPLVAVTGTNGKTTVTGWVAEMLVASGRRAVAAGNIGFPLCEGVQEDVDTVVAEVSSFQLRFTERFRPAVAVWLNLADDHLDWHGDPEAYRDAKARIWANQEDDDVAVVNADDPAVVAAAAAAPARVVTFGLVEPADYRVDRGRLVGPGGPLLAVDELARAMPHDLANALAAAAAAQAAGATPEGIAAALRAARPPAHRLSLVAEAGGVRWYDDSKATNPHAVLAALRSFDVSVLVAGGRNKGLDLGVLAGEVERVRAVVAIGEAAPEVEAAFAGLRRVTRAASMAEAVRAAAAVARPGDAVVLAPGCASFDWYRSYAERGDDFARSVRELLEGAPDA